MEINESRNVTHQPDMHGISVHCYYCYKEYIYTPEEMIFGGPKLSLPDCLNTSGTYGILSETNGFVNVVLE